MSERQVSTLQDKSLAMKLYERMLLIRRSEEALSKAAKAGELPGGVHLYIGQEASAVGVCSVLDDKDFITSTHRGHGHFIAKGGALKTMFAELWGKRTGICQGMGGSMHVADVSKGILGANGIVGGGLAIATGAGLGAKLAGKQAVAVCFFGDGAANQGVMMESLNCSMIWQLPTIFVCENNGFSEFTVSSKVTAGKLSDRARAMGMAAYEVDGNDIIDVRQAAEQAVTKARAGQGPSFIEMQTYRIHGHLEAEEAFLGGYSYRTQEEIDQWKTAEKDPILRFSNFLITQFNIDKDRLSAINSDICQQVDEAIAYAKGSEDANVDLIHDITFFDQRP